MGLISSDFLLQLVGLLVAIVIGAYIYLKYVTYNYWKNKGIVQVDPVFLFGNMWPIVSAKTSIGEHLRDLYLKFKDKPVGGFYSFHVPSLMIQDYDLLRFVLTKEFSSFRNRGMYSNDKVDPLSANVFMASDERWKHLRTKFGPTFTSTKMKHMYSVLKVSSDSLAECVANEMKKNEFVEMKDIMARFTTDVIASAAFGIECNSLKNPDAEFRQWGRRMAEGRPITNALMIFCPSLLRLLNIPTTPQDVTDFLISAFKETVQYRRANNVVRNDFIDLIMQLMDKGYVDHDNNEASNGSEPTTEKITMLEGAAQVFVFWVAGFETSSAAATHCLYELALNQQVQDKLADEIKKIQEEFNGLTYESINAMPYLDQVASETLRKYPSLPLLNRECNEDIDLPGINIRIKKGTPIIIPVLGLHYDPETYPDPNKFDPERFTEENIKNRNRYAYLPFGDGPRYCIGKRFGLMQMKVGLATLVSKFRFELGPDTPVPLVMDPGIFLMGVKNGVSLRVERR